MPHPAPVTLEDEQLSLMILPECGGKIRSIINRRTGRDWLWHNPHLPQAVPEYGQPYVTDLDTGGWDELFPSVSPGTFADGTSVPDHGDLVGLPWKILARTELELTMEVRARSVPATLQRTVRLAGKESHVGSTRSDRDAPDLILDYTLTFHSGRSHPYLYAAHPLFALEAGSEIQLPAGTSFAVEGALGDTPHQAGDTIAWPAGFRCRPETPAHALKLFTGSGAVDRVTLTHSSGESLELSWTAAQLPHLGIWLNHHAWSGVNGVPYFNLGLEPGTAPADTPDWEAPLVDTPDVLRWSIELRIK